MRGLSHASKGRILGGMEHPRLSRFKRSPAATPFQLTERDREIIRQVNRHRFLRSPQIIGLVGGSAQQILRRLQRLYHAGYLARPKAQLEYFRTGGSHHMVYGLGNKGASFINGEGRDSAYPRSSEKNQGIGRVFLNHALMVSDVMVEIELACRESGRVRLLWGNELPVSGTLPRPFRWRVKLKNGRKRGVIPDRVFALESMGQNVVNQRAFFFLEADRGTTPVLRTDMSQNSMYRKFLSYEATWAQAVHQKQFGFHRFRVLTVTTSAKRVASLIQACRKLEQGHGLFLFANLNALKGRILSEVWNTCREDGASSLLN